MTLILRACILTQSKRFTQEFNSFGRTLTCFTHDRDNFKKYSEIIQTRNIFTHDIKSEEPLLVYEGPSKMQIRRLKMFSFLTSFGGILAQPPLYMKAAAEANMLAVIAISSLIGFFTLATPLLIQVLAKRYITDLYYYPKEDVYLAKTYTLFLRSKETRFTVDDVRVPDLTGMFSCCTIKGKPMFFDESHFTDMTHYFRIMGAYKPIDFKLGNVEPVNVVKEEGNREKIANKQ